MRFCVGTGFIVCDPGRNLHFAKQLAESLRTAKLGNEFEHRFVPEIFPSIAVFSCVSIRTSTKKSDIVTREW